MTDTDGVSEIRNRSFVSRPIRTYVIGYGKPGPQDVVKIGQTNRLVRERLEDLQTGSPWRLCVLWSAAVNAEKYLHEYFADARLTGEWFRLADAETRVLEAMAARSSLRKTEAERRYTLGPDECGALTIRGRPCKWRGDDCPNHRRFSEVTTAHRVCDRSASALDALKGVNWAAITSAGIVGR